MADEETQGRRLQVANARPEDSGRGLARLSRVTMQALGLSEGDVVELVGKRSTGARAVLPYQEDDGLELVRLDAVDARREPQADKNDRDDDEAESAEPSARQHAAQAILAAPQDFLEIGRIRTRRRLLSGAPGALAPARAPWAAALRIPWHSRKSPGAGASARRPSVGMGYR